MPEENKQLPAVSNTQLPVADKRLAMKAADEIVVRYKPYAGTEKWLMYRFSDWNNPKAWFSCGLMMLFFACGGPGFLVEQIVRIVSGSAYAAQATATGSASLDLMIVQILTYLLGGTALTVGAVVSRHPSYVAVNRQGIALEWPNFKMKRFLPWAKVEHIELFYPPGKTSPQDCMVRFKEAGSTGTYPISLRLGAISTTEERALLLQAIEQWGSTVGRDAQLIDVLAPPEDHSYTELWLQALSAPPKRERLAPLHEGATLRDGRYSVIGQLGVGGQGTAYLATRLPDRHEIVLKEFILPVYVEVNVRRQALERMQNEASMLSRLDNERIVRLLDFFVEDHRGYLVLEKIDGLSLKGIVMKDGKMSEERVVSLARQMCKMLEYLHSLTPPVVHRDFTPDNLILGKDGILKLVDFNVAQQTEVTATGTVVGKHAYIAPEQFRGKPTPQSDIYAMGATLFYLVTGEDPEPITCSHPLKTNLEITKSFDDLVARATVLDAGKRYKSVEQLEADLPPAAVAVASVADSAADEEA